MWPNAIILIIRIWRIHFENVLYLQTKIKFVDECLQKLEHKQDGQTDRQTHSKMRHHLHSWLQIRIKLAILCLKHNVMFNPFNPLTPELPQHGVPRPGAPTHNIVYNIFSKFPSWYFVFMGINQRPTGRYFGHTGICNGRRSRFFGLTGWEG